MRDALYTCRANQEFTVVKQVRKSEAEWASILTPEQFAILLNAGKERPFTGEYCHTKSSANIASP